MKKLMLSISGIIAGLITLTLIVESIEILSIMKLSGKTLSEFQDNQILYFTIRNQNWFLAFKLFYTAIAAFIAGVLCSKTSKQTSNVSVTILIVIQLVSLLYGMLISEFKNTTPLYIWITLCFVIPLFIYLGHLFIAKKRLTHNKNNL